MRMNSDNDLTPRSEVYEVPLNCHYKGHASPIVIFLKRDLKRGGRQENIRETMRIYADLLFSMDDLDKHLVPYKIVHTSPIYVK